MTNLVLSFIVWLNTYESLFAFIVLVLTIISVVILPLCKLIRTPKPKVNVSFKEGDKITIYPKYRKLFSQKLDNGERLTKFVPFISEECTRTGASYDYDNRWCEVFMTVKNIGKVALKGYYINVEFEKDKIENLDVDNGVDDRHPLNEEYDDPDDARRASVVNNHIIYKPVDTLVEGETTIFSFYLMPRDGVTDIKAEWTFTLDYLKKSGELTIHVEPRV